MGMCLDALRQLEDVLVLSFMQQEPPTWLACHRAANPHGVKISNTHDAAAGVNLTEVLLSLLYGHCTM